MKRGCGTILNVFPSPNLSFTHKKGGTEHQSVRAGVHVRVNNKTNLHGVYINKNLNGRVEVGI